MLQSFVNCVKKLIINNRPIPQYLEQHIQRSKYIQHRSIHTTPSCGRGEPKKFLAHNKKFFPIQQPGEEKRPAVSCYHTFFLEFTF